VASKSFSFIKASNLVVIIIKVTHINKNYEEIFNRIDLLRDNLYRYECEFATQIGQQQSRNHVGEYRSFGAGGSWEWQLLVLRKCRLSL